MTCRCTRTSSTCHSSPAARPTLEYCKTPVENTPVLHSPVQQIYVMCNQLCVTGLQTRQVLSVALVSSASCLLMTSLAVTPPDLSNLMRLSLLTARFVFFQPIIRLCRVEVDISSVLCAGDLCGSYHWCCGGQNSASSSESRQSREDRV